jgi:hypothetical protein
VQLELYEKQQHDYLHMLREDLQAEKTEEEDFQ